MISRSRPALLALLLALPLAAGCAYSLGPTNQRVAGAQSISIDPFPNQTTEPQLTDLVVTALRREVQRDGTFQLGTRGGADVVVMGTITSYGRLPVGSKRDDVLTPTVYDVKITAHVRAMRGTETVYEGDISGTAQVAFNSDLNNAERENNPVAAENLARNLISAIANGKLVNPRPAALLPLLLGLFLQTPSPLSGADWPQWRGPDRTGHTADPLPASLPASVKPLWRLPLGHGYAGPVVGSGMLVVLDDANGQETAHGLDPKTGARRWSTPLGENYVDEFEPGPRCTPVIFEDRLYTQTARGEFRCLRLADGHTLWRTNFKDLGMVWNPERNTGIGAANRRGNTGSPLVSKDRVLVQVGSTNGASIVAFEPRTGRLLWKSQDDLTAYTSPVLAEVAGRPQFITATCNGLLALAPEDGRVLWRVPFRSLANRNVLTPIVLGDTIYFASHSTGLRAVRVRRDGEGFQAEETWLNPKLRLNLSTPVAVGGHLYGLGAAKDYVSINTRDGSVDWSQPGFGDVAATLASGSRLLVLTDLGELLLLAANPERYEELGRVQVTGKTYVHPAYADGVLYVRDPRELQAIRLTPQ